MNYKNTHNNARHWDAKQSVPLCLAPVRLNVRVYMKKIPIFLIFVISVFAYAGEDPTWSERAGYKLLSEHEIALNAAKKYTKNETINELTVHYEYQISTTKEGFYVFVIQYTLNEDNKKLYYPGTHFALDIDKNGNVIKLHPGS